VSRSGAVFATAFFVGFLGLGAPVATWAQGPVSFTPASAQRIDRIALDQIHAGRTPGIAIGVVEDGRLVYAKGFGFATLSPHAAITPDTEFYAGGITTQFTAAAVLLLAQDGKLKLDDPISNYVPEFRMGKGITVSQLLTQTSGLPNYSAARGGPNDPTKSVKLSEILAAVDKMPPAAAPGSVYANNPLNYLLAGLIVERVSGVTLSDYLEQHIFIPLVMNHSFIAGDNGISASRATGYTRDHASFRTAATWDPAWLGGQGGLVTTVDDLAKWDIEMPVLLRVDSVRTIFTPGTQSGPTRYGMGWVVDRRGGSEFDWSNGEISGYRAMNAVLPAQHVSVIVLSNADSMHGSVTVPEQVAARVLDVLVPATAVLDNPVMTKARDWLERLASGRIDRAALTPTFSAYLTDEVVSRANFASLGRLQEIVPLSSSTEGNGDTLYEFLVRYPHGEYHYHFELAPNGKVDGISLIG
jgi:D-alanyl-D-alanine carboxypeptidase